MKRLLYLMILVLLSGAIIFLPACSSDESESEELVDNTDDLGEGDDDDSSDGDSDDDDSPSDTGSETAGQLTTSDGETLWITAVGSYVFEYDEGKLVMIGDYILTDNPLTATYYDEDYTETCYLTVNSSGYVSQLKIDENDDLTYTLKYSYNSAGHLTKIEGGDSWVDEDESYSSSGDLTMELTWEGDYLQKSVMSYTYSGEDEDGSYEGSITSTIIYEYGDDTYPNVTWQYTPATAYAVEFGYYDYDLMDGLAFVGYFGKGPSYHPDSCDYEEEVEKWEEDGEWDEEVYSDSLGLSCMYSINSDGTVYSYEDDNTSTVYFKYADYSSYLSSSSSSNTKSLETFEEATVGSSSHRSIGRSRMRSRHLTNR